VSIPQLQLYALKLFTELFLLPCLQDLNSNDAYDISIGKNPISYILSSKFLKMVNVFFMPKNNIMYEIF